MFAERAYLFRHALVREAAYELQPPGDRAILHGLALELLETLLGGRPPKCSADEPLNGPVYAVDSFAHELAEHARLALESVDDSAIADARRAYLLRAALHADRTFRPHSSIEYWHRYAKLVDGRERGIAIGHEAEAHRLAGAAPNAQPLLIEACEILRAAGSVHDEARALSKLANTYKDTTIRDKAEESYKAAMALHRKAGDIKGEATALANLAGVYRQTGRWDESDASFQESLRLFDEVGEQDLKAAALANYAHLFRARGEIDRAEEALVQALEMHQKLGNRRAEGVALSSLAVLHQEAGRLDEAARMHQLSIEIHREVGNRRFEGITLTNWANFMEDPDAVRALHEAQLLLKEAGDRHFQAVALGNLAAPLAHMGRLEEALQAATEAMVHHQTLGNRRFEAVATSTRGFVLAKLKRDAEAVQHHLRAIQICQDIKDRRTEGLHRCEFARYYITRNRRDEAQAMWRQGAALLHESDADAWLVNQCKRMKEDCEEAGMDLLDPYIEDEAGKSDE